MEGVKPGTWQSSPSSMLDTPKRIHQRWYFRKVGRSLFGNSTLVSLYSQARVQYHSLVSRNNYCLLRRRSVQLLKVYNARPHVIISVLIFSEWLRGAMTCVCCHYAARERQPWWPRQSRPQLCSATTGIKNAHGRGLTRSHLTGWMVNIRCRALERLGDIAMSETKK